MKTHHTTKSSRTLLTPLALALTLGAGLGAGTAQAQIIEVGGAATIGDSILTTSSGVAKLPTAGANWTVPGGIGNTFSSLVSPSVVVANPGSVTLTFTHRYDFEHGFDGGAVYVNVNGGGFVAVPLFAFSSNGYDDLAQPPVWIGDEEIFTGQSTDYGVPALITSVADLGLLNPADTVAVEFRGGWNSNTNGADPNWEIGSVEISDTGATLLDADFTPDGAGFTASVTGTGNSPWGYNAPGILRFELDANTDTADRCAADMPASVIDLNGASIEIVLLNGTLLSGDVFSLFDLSAGTTLTGSLSSISLPPGLWDTSSLATAGTITLTTAFNPADGTWITEGNGNWTDPANWDSNTIAYGTDKTADLSVGVIAPQTANAVTLGADITIGNITKNVSFGPIHTLTIQGSETLTLDVTTGSPVITNSDTNFNSAKIQFNCPLASSDGLTIDGGGMVILGNATTTTGDTNIDAGFLGLGTIDLANFGGGAGRNIFMAAGTCVQRHWQNMDNAFLNRLDETTNEIGIFFTPTGGGVLPDNDLDFSSGGAGADLPNAFISTFGTNTTRSQYNGIITPASDNYRLGHPSQSGSLHIAQAHGDVIGDPRGLIVGGGAVVLAGDNTFTGNTVLQAGRLFLGRKLCLQNSALNVGNGIDGNTGEICFLNSGGGGALPAVELTDEPTLGGLVGNRNLAAIYDSASQSSTSPLAIGSILGLTLDVDTGKTFTYAGNARLAPTMYLTKDGPGTQVLSGANDYTGATSVNEGTLALVGGSHASPITVASGASLDFTLGLTTTSTKSVTLDGGHTIKITGAVDNASDYTLMTTTSTITGMPTLDSPIDDYVLFKGANQTKLMLVYVGVGSAYGEWSGGAAADIDSNGDGVSNGVAWALGALDPSANAIGLLPTLDNTSDATYAIFNFNRGDAAAADSNTTITVQYGSNLAGWTTAVDDNDNVDIIISPGSPTDAVQVKLKRSTLAGGGKLFARLNVVVAP